PRAWAPFSGLARAWQYTALLDIWERNIWGCKSFPGNGFLCGYIRLIEPHYLNNVATQPYKGIKRLPAGAPEIQFYAARFTTRYRSDK
ncbi:hypothetical protein, partial [Candidatus Avelusimicrobium alvi]|uniref:hypothetical protein n=1 Tax=Candidatus Avelusimicrobium alvi TaxID=3416221 RepID=UPI003D0E1E03